MERTIPYSWIGAAIKGMLSAGNRQRKSMQRRMVSRSFVLKPVHFGMLRRTRPFSTHWMTIPACLSTATISISSSYRISTRRIILLPTLPSISQISRRDMNRSSEYWLYTTLSSQKWFAEVFAEEQVTVEPYGNVLSAITLLHASPAENLHHHA